MKVIIKVFVTLFLVIFTYFTEVCTAQWVQTNGPWGGYVSLFQISLNRIIAGGYGGYFITSDNGNTWQNYSNLLIPNSKSFVNSSAFIGSNSFLTTDYGVYKSTDNGISWNLSNNGLPLGNIRGEDIITINNDIYIVVDSSNSSTFLGVYKSSNFGNSWTQINNGLPNSIFSTYGSGTNLATDGNRIYLSYGSQLFKTTNFGVNWDSVSTGISYSFSELFVNGTSLFAVLYIPSSYNTIYKSTNQGLNWVLSNNGLPNNIHFGNLITVSGNIYYANDMGVFVSSNDGVNWSVRNNGLLDNDADNIIYINNSLLISVPILGVYKSTNLGSSWFQSANGINNIPIYSFGVNGNVYFAGVNSDGGFQGVYSSSDNGNSWIHKGLERRDINCFLTLNSEVYAGTDSGIAKTSNNGINWTFYNSGLPIPVPNISTIVNNGNDLYVKGYYNIFKSTNFGVSWFSVNNGLPSGNIFIHCLTVSNNVLICGVDSAYSSQNNYFKGIYLSTNGGTNWYQSNSGMPPKFSLSSLYNAGNILYAAIDTSYTHYTYTYNYLIYVSTNNGNSWSYTNNSLVNPHPFCHINNIVFACCSDGIYYTYNNGVNWKLFNTGLPANAEADAIKVMGSYIYAGFEDFGLWRRPLTDVSVQNISTEIPSKYSLSQNYPNPFNPTTNIIFDVAKSSEVKIIVYDIMGREVQTLVNEKLITGTYEVSFDASKYPSGVYFYKFETENYSETKKMVLIK